jgi:hypothetical protein
MEAAEAAQSLLRDVLESLCRRDGLPLDSIVEPGKPARNYELAERLGIGHVFGIGPCSPEEQVDDLRRKEEWFQDNVGDPDLYGGFSPLEQASLGLGKLTFEYRPGDHKDANGNWRGPETVVRGQGSSMLDPDDIIIDRLHRYYGGIRPISTKPGQQYPATPNYDWTWNLTRDQVEDALDITLNGNASKEESDDSDGN